MTRDEADAAMIQARHDRNVAVAAVNRLFNERRKQIQTQCPHDGKHGALLAPGGSVAYQWCTVCEFEFPKCTHPNERSD